MTARQKVKTPPPAAINALNQDELLDLVAYFVSGGNAKDKAFTNGGRSAKK